MAHLRTFQAGVHQALSEKLLNEVVAARLCLLSAEKRVAYDAELRERLDAEKQLPQVATPAESPPFARIQDSDLPLAKPWWEILSRPARWQRLWNSRVSVCAPH